MDKAKIRLFIHQFIYRLPKKIAHSILYFRHHGKIIDWKNPKTYDEKIHWLMTNVYDETYGKYADKLTVREYVAECGLQHLLIPLLGVYDKVQDINYNCLPSKFILKTSSGSGEKYYVLCKDKKHFSSRDAAEKLDKALKENFAIWFCEYQYEENKSKIICELLLEDSTDARLTDYKVVCTYGIPRAILVCSNRNEGRDYYSTDWKYLEYVKNEFRSGKIANKPGVLDEMLKAAEILSKPFPLSRIDFYIIENRVYFGEITLSPSSGNHKNLSEYGQMELGKFIDLKRGK